MALNKGATFAGYRIIRLLGSGGMGEVYLAEHPRLPRRDAVKILSSGICAGNTRGSCGFRSTMSMDRTPPQ